jgi:capsular exopolysaccharide synthesis family protein
MNPIDFQEIWNLTDYRDVLHRHRKMITQFFLTVVLVVTAGSFLMTPIYRSTVIILIDEASPNVLTTTGNVALQSQDYLSFKEYYQSQIEIFTSMSLARKVFNDFELGAMPEYANAKEPVKAFLKSVKVEPVRDSRLIKLNVENKDPVLATKMANRWADLFVKRNLYYISRSELMNLFKNEYLKLESKQAEFSKIYKDKHPAMIELKDQLAELVQKIERVKKSSFDYSSLEQDMQAQGRYAIEGLKPNNISIQDPADLPTVPVKPKKRVNILLSMIVGLFGGVAMAFFIENQNKTIKDVEDIEALTGWPFLGKVPTVEGFLKEFTVKNKAVDMVTEAFRTIRTRLFFADTKEHPLRSIVISSLGAQEGKSLISCNLAIAIAQTNKRVLLVDADMRRPRLHEVFKKRDAKGLSNYLSGHAHYDELIQPTDIENFSIVVDKHSITNSTELLNSERMREFIALTKKNFDFVLFDSPPVGILMDAVILASQLDGVALVVESAKTPVRAVLRNDKLLKNANVKVIGVIINRVLTTGSEGYYYSHHYSHPHSHP